MRASLLRCALYDRLPTTVADLLTLLACSILQVSYGCSACTKVDCDAGTIMAFFAAVTCALAFFVIGYIPKSEPSLVVAIWFHGASLASSVPFLAVSTLSPKLLQQMAPSLMHCRPSSGPHDPPVSAPAIACSVLGSACVGVCKTRALPLSCVSTLASLRGIIYSWNRKHQPQICLSGNILLLGKGMQAAEQCFFYERHCAS